MSAALRRVRLEHNKVKECMHSIYNALLGAGETLEVHERDAVDAKRE